MNNKSALNQRTENIVTRLQRSFWYALLMAGLALLGFGFLVYEFTPDANKTIVDITVKLDLIIACIFLTDFILGLFFNHTYTRSEYWRKNWLDFIASIPITADVARFLRIFRIIRALRVIVSVLDIWSARRRFKHLKK